MKIYRISMDLERDPENPLNVMLYHATRKPNLVRQNGLIPNRAGVITKMNESLVFFAKTPIMAKMALQYEEELRERVSGISPSKNGMIFIVQVSLPEEEINIRTNNDITISRTVSASEIKNIFNI